MPLYNGSHEQIFPVPAPSGKVLNDYGQWVDTGGGGPHTHPESEITNLTTDLGAKATSNHTHTEYCGTGDSRLSDARTPTTHGHAQSEVTGLTDALGGKCASNDARLSDARTPTAHGHAESDITNLVTDLAGKETPSGAQGKVDAHKDLTTGCHGNLLHSNSSDHSNAGDHAHANKATLDTYTQTEVNLADAVTKKHANTLDHDNSRANGKPVYAALANDTLAQDYATNSCTKLTVTAARTLTTTVPPAGCQAHTIILTSGTTSYTITFGTGFKPTGTLATGTTSGRVFVVHWISDGTNLYESGRTAAMVA